MMDTTQQEDTELKPIIPYIEYLLSFTGSEDDWFKLKVQLVNLCPPKIKGMLSRRHYSTKKHLISDFDKKVINYIQRRLNRTLFIDETKLHDSNWQSRPRGWALEDINKARKKQDGQTNKSSA